MDRVSTDSLRALAPKWSLAGDDQLLNLLQSTHQKIVLKCRDVNSKLEEMSSALDDASISLQNVNNKFMALSNSQFIESRVYDDDADVSVDTQTAQSIPPPSPIDELSLLKSSLAALERAHEAAEIVDDSDSDSDLEISVVLKPKDMYSHRPLPYIIGSQNWRSKWHAGLIVEDSDTDSSTSKQDRDIEQYSDSEEEMTRPPLEEHTVSESSSSLPGSLDSPQAARPADVAAALARRLAEDATTIVQREPEEYPPVAPAQHKKVYKPEQPATSAIFSDEPPPLGESSGLSSDEDIFAEINKHTPYTQRNKVESNLAEDLFSFEKPPVEAGDIFSDFANVHVNKPTAKQKTTLFEDESEPELFAEPPKSETQNNAVEKDEPSTKKPVGGISLFGSNKGTENIGAAILKRNQRKSSTSGDESGSDDVTNRRDSIKKQIPEKPKVLVRNDYNKSDSQETTKVMDETDNKSMTKKEKDIFDDLFSKSEKIQKKTPPATKQPIKQVTPVKEKSTAVKQKEKSVKDLFSDNMFDDIDDIFTSDVKIPTKESNESNQKSIFDDDDLFSDIDIVKTTNQKTNKEYKSTLENNEPNAKDVKSKIKDTKSIFDSDDELFSEIRTDTKKITKNIDSHASKYSLTDDNEAADKIVNSKVISKTDTIIKPTETTKERNLFDDSPQAVKSDPKPQMKSKSIFDSDSDDDIFATVRTPNVKKTTEAENVFNSSKNDNKTVEEDLFKTENTKSKNELTNVLKSKEKNIVQSPSLFEEDEIDDLFIAANKKLEAKGNKDTKVAEVNTPSLEQEQVIETNIKVNEINFASKVDNKEKDLPKNPTDPKPDNVEKSHPEPRDMKSGKNNIFDDDEDEDDLFSKPEDVSKHKPSEKMSVIIESSQNVSELRKKETINVDSNTVKQILVVDTKNVQVEINKTQEPELENAEQSVFDDFIETEKEKETLTTDTNVPVPSANPIFDDLLTEPPAFEKPAEPKKSKNVNALFDDDSDDESLFFKKDDVISDEKPDIFSKNANFGIFVDEPPAIDVDFTTKLVKNANIDDISEDDLFSSVLKSKNLQSKKTINDEEDIFSPAPEKGLDVSKPTDSDSVNEDDLFTSVSKTEIVPKSTKNDNSVNFNNVPETQEKVPVNVIEQNTIDDKPKKSNEVSEPEQNKLFDKNEDKDLFSRETDTIRDISKVKKPEILSSVIDSDEELFASLPHLPNSSQKDQNNATKSEQNDIKTNFKKNDEFDDIFKAESPKKDAEVKKIGKLNTKNFNINVNALIPGASPKKVPKEQKDEQKSETDEPRMVKIIPDATDFESKPTHNKDLNETKVLKTNTDKPVPDETDFKPKLTGNENEYETAEQEEPKTDKPITFEDKSDLGVLDNNVSKQRPRIQIKRRPSSRKARHEAVRKSGIDFGDETDNSSSFDEPKPKKNNKNFTREDNLTKQDNLATQDNLTKEDNASKKDPNLSKEAKKTINEDTISKDESQTTKSQKDNKTQKEDNSEENDIFKDILTNIPSHKDSVPTPSFSKKIKETRQDLTQNLNENKQTTTKIVYILNDEDIFNTDIKNTEKSGNIFESTNSETNIFKDEVIKTLGKDNKEELTPKIVVKEEIKNQQQNITTKDVKTNKDKASLFDDSDEELFNNKKKIVKKTTIFDSDSEEDLFSGKKSTEKKNKQVRNKEVKEKKEVVVRGSLFGDDDDDDDLFGTKKQKAEPKHQPTIPSTSKEAYTSGTTTSKAAEPVFDDPLSMLGEDD